MSYLKSSIATLLFLILFLVGYVIFAFTPMTIFDKAFEFYTMGDYSSGLKTIESGSAGLPKVEALLYRSYLFRSQGSIKLSEQALAAAEALFTPQTKDRVRLEIYLNQAFNGYLENSVSQMKEALAKTSVYRENPWVLFFKAIQEELANFSPEQVPILNKWSSVLMQQEPLSPWMQREFGNHFNSFWQKTILIKALIYQEKYMEARKFLDQELALENKKNQDTLNQLFGLSFEREAGTKSLAHAGPYYQQAYTYYKRLPIHEKKYQALREQFFEKVFQQVSYYIDYQIYDELEFFILTLEDLDKENEVGILSSKLSSVLSEKLAENDLKNAHQLAMLLNRVTQENTRKNLTLQIKKLIEEAINQGDFHSARNYLNLTATIAHDQTNALEQLLNVIKNRIFDRIQNLSDLNQLSQLGFLWKEVNKSLPVCQRMKFAKSLKEMGLEFISEDHPPEIAVEAFNLALEISAPEQDQINREISGSLAKIYSTSYQEKNLHILSRLCTICQRVQLIAFSLPGFEQQKNYLREAQLLFANKKYSEAGLLADWILELSPNNKAALMISGLANYFEYNYDHASDMLNQVGVNSRDHKEALAISNILSGNLNIGLPLFEQLEKSSNPPSKESYLRLGFGELLNERPKQALCWLQKVRDRREARLGELIAASQQLQWKKVLTLIEKLNPEDASLQLVESLKIQAYIHLQQLEEAHEALDGFLKTKKNMIEGQFSDVFRDFIEKSYELYSQEVVKNLFESFSYHEEN